MPPLYIIQQNTRLNINNRRLQVVSQDQVLTSKPLAQVSQVILFGNIGLTTPAISALLKNGIETVFLTKRGDYLGRLVGSITPHVPLRRAQYSRLNQPDFILELAKGFVAAKLSHQRALLMRHNRKLHNSDINTAVQRIKHFSDLISSKTALTSLLGLEGAGTAAYFRGYRLLFSPRWKFTKRNRRPPRDPVNVLLSFGYTLITQLAGSAVRTVGLDPYAGFLHQVAYNRPALALDLVEEFRAVVDGVVLWCCNSGQISITNFSPGTKERPVVLDEDGQRCFLQAYEHRMDQRFTHPLLGIKYPLRQCVIEQARQIAECVRSGHAGYRGMGFR